MPENKQSIIDHFEIPDELAKELSDLLTKQAIREKILGGLILQDKDSYEAAEEVLVPIVQRIEAIKYKITNEFVPQQYRKDRYMWNYNGYEIDKNKVEVIGDKE